VLLELLGRLEAQDHREVQVLQVQQALEHQAPQVQPEFQAQLAFKEAQAQLV
jgi:hypothetical protein